MKRFFILSLLAFGALWLQSQSLQLREVNSNKIITNDTVTVQSVFTSWIGYESLDLAVAIDNKSNKTIEVGARKIELNPLQKDVLHTICFAGGCYDTGTYVSPNHVALNSGGSDSTFLAHYLFDNRVHIRGISFVEYQFYDVQNPSDSARVIVKFNSLIKNAGIDYNVMTNVVELFPNPAKCGAELNLNLTTGIAFSRIEMLDVLGNVIMKIDPETNRSNQVINTKEFAPGIYFLNIRGENNQLISKKVVLY